MIEEIVDIYYVDLARFLLNDAHKNLSQAQEYLRKANLEQEGRQAQLTINRVRKQLDRLGDIPITERR